MVIIVMVILVMVIMGMVILVVMRMMRTKAICSNTSPQRAAPLSRPSHTTANYTPAK